MPNADRRRQKPFTAEAAERAEHNPSWFGAFCVFRGERLSTSSSCGFRVFSGERLFGELRRFV
jgi:hypothetical protein